MKQISIVFSSLCVAFGTGSLSAHGGLEINYRDHEEIIGLYQQHLIAKREGKISPITSILQQITEQNGNYDESRPRHILTIMTDDQGWGDIGYHDPTFVTPVIDYLANNGINLNNFHVQCTCTPTRASMLTGKYVTETGLQDGALIPGESRHLPRSLKTVGEYFQSAGYSTNFFGKWHLGQEYSDLLPNARGYDYFYGSLGGIINHYTKEIGLACGEPGDQFSTIYGKEQCKLLNGYDLQENGVPVIEQETYNSFLQASRGIDLISSHNLSLPLLMHYHTNEPHAPLQAPSTLTDLCEDVSLPEEGIPPFNRQLLCGMVTSVDLSIFRLLLALYDHDDMLRDTLIVYHSDNGGWIQGGSINRPFQGEKGTVFEGGVHVPAFLYGNGLRDVSPSLRTDLVHVSDLLPTLLSYAGIPFLSHEFDGISHWDSLRSDTPLLRSSLPLNSASEVVYHFTALYETFTSTVAEISPSLSSSLSSSPSSSLYKYLYNPSVISFLLTASLNDLYTPEGEYLFNLSQDPYETTNLLSETGTAAGRDSVEIDRILHSFRRQVLLLQETSVPSQLEVIPPKIEVYPSEKRCWVPKDSLVYYNFSCSSE